MYTCDWTGSGNFQEQLRAVDYSDAVVLAGQHSIVVHVSGHMTHHHVVDAIFRYEVCSILSVVVEIVDVFAAGPDASVFN